MEAVPPYRADVAIRGDSIVAIVKDLSNAQCRERLDVRGKCLVRGFIDLHSHADAPDINTGLRSYNPIRRAALNLVTQEITNVVVNQDGRGPIDIARQFSLNSPLLSIEKKSIV
jgi:N-acyl-D-aspartate/D-glutamate deacylase